MTASKKLKGIVFFFVNMYPDLGQEIEPTLRMFKESTKSLLDRLQADGEYVVFFVPTTKEATRVEKVDYDAPFPRSVPHLMAPVQYETPVKRKKNMFVNEPEVDDEAKSKGFISIFLNFHPEHKLDQKALLTMVRAVNDDSIQRIADDRQFDLVIVPTTKEASRIEKIDYDFPFPRFVPISPPTKRVEDVEKEADEDELDDEDEE